MLKCAFCEKDITPPSGNMIPLWLLQHILTPHGLLLTGVEIAPTIHHTEEAGDEICRAMEKI